MSPGDLPPWIAVGPDTGATYLAYLGGEKILGIAGVVGRARHEA